MTVNRVFSQEVSAVLDYLTLTSGYTNISSGAETAIMAQLWLHAAEGLVVEITPELKDVLHGELEISETSFRNSLVKLQKKGLITKNSKRGAYNLNKHIFQELDGSDLEFKLNVKLK